jgi:two-component system response regulator RstA
MMHAQQNHRVLVVDDDTRLTSLIADYFRREGFEVDVENDGRSGGDRILADRPDLVILDLMMPGEDGLSVCRRVRGAGYGGAILMLTARRDEIDQVVGLEMGADDYVPKPASPRLLLARVRALLRRKVSTRSDERLIHGSLVVDRSARTAAVAGQLMELTTAEFDLLWALTRQAGTPVTREALIRELRGINYDGVDRSMDVRVSQLRKKLRATGQLAPEIKTVRSVGYQLVSPR